MKILQIQLFNIGSYEGLNQIEINNNDKNVILIGGKNGAGKTTLFEAIKLCLYGCRESGYQIMNNLYKKRIKSIINDFAKLETRTTAYVQLKIEIFNGQDNDTYILKRTWNLTTDIFEDFIVQKNGLYLNQTEIEEFTSYLLNQLPPELFNLYFFDGEQIADTFLGETGNEKVKDAFLVLCGYDTFDLMLQNFKRISFNKKHSDISSSVYFKSREIYEETKQKQKAAHENIDNAYKELEQIGNTLVTLDEKYRKQGGVSLEEWNNKISEILQQEKYREGLNTEIKKYANELIPFIILEKNIDELIKQIDSEDEYNRRKNLYKELKKIVPKVIAKTFDNYSMEELLLDYSNKLKENLLESVKLQDKKTILNLSTNEQNSIRSLVNNIGLFNKEIVINNRLELKKSLNKTKELKQELDNCNITNVQEYMHNKEALTAKKEEILNSLQSLLSEKTAIDEDLFRISAQYKHDSKVVEEELKNNSIVDISTKSIFFLENLQKELLETKIKQVEKLFMQKLNELKRKDSFLDKIVIDDDFNIHVYKRIVIKCNQICAKINEIGIKRYKEENGIYHYNDILSITQTSTLEDFIQKYKNSNEVFDVMHEFEKQRLSKGEKQIFIMSLYWALMTLSKKNIPFMMDTPFARIDKEHRKHITENFFKQLEGQVFIFSTDEEIVNEHIEILKDKINKTFLLENKQNKKTTIIENKYF